MKKKCLLLLVMFILAFYTIACSSNDVQSSDTELLETTLAETEQTGIYVAGTYTASAEGNNGPVTLSVTFSEDAIIEIKIIEHNETGGTSDGAFNLIPPAIVEYQSLGVSAVSGCTYSSMAILNAVADCVKQAGGDVEALKSVPAGEDSATVLQDTETDVLIIGGGGAGLSAAVSALENGARVIVIEKLGNLGGNTRISGGAFNASDAELQKDVNMNTAMKATVEDVLAHEDVSTEHAQLKEKVQQQWDEYINSGSTTLFDSPEWHALQTLDAGDYIGNVELVYTLTSEAPNVIEWLSDNGVVWNDHVSIVAGALWYRSHETPNGSGADFITALETVARENGAEIYLETKGEELIVEDGRVVGAVITNADGDLVTVRASKGVIMATGGFGANVEMREKYNTQWSYIGEDMPTLDSEGTTGDGIVMGEAVGASLIGMEWIQVHPQANPISGGAITGDVNNSIFVNKEGERFVAEDERRDVLSKAIMNQTDQMYYMINDSLEAERRGVSLQTIEYMVQNGMLYRGETLAELASVIGVPADALEESVAKYNDAVRAGDGDVFGRAILENTIETGPFYAAAFGPGVHHTMGGLEINVNAEVIDTNGNVIPGFYAAGEVTGGIHGTNRVGGNAVPDALVFGKIAGTNAASD